MPSPFPGMDPYLEDPGLWPDVHHGLISASQEFLNRQLRPKYHVRVEERVYLSDETDPGRSVLVPDLRIADHPGRERSASSTTGAATLELIEPVVATALIDDEIHEARLQVIDRADRQVVTVIEVLSPSNKVPGSRGQASYLETRREIMTSPSHWVEIDLLRRGASPLAGVPLASHDDLIHVSRVDRRPKGWLGPIRLPQRLPVVAIPLREGDPDAQLDLQRILETAYDRAGYDLEVDSRSEPIPPLAGEVREWAEALLRERGLR